LTQPPQKPDPARRPPTFPPKAPPTIHYAGGSAPVAAGGVSTPPAPPPPPRPITTAAKRRSWTDPLIRFWILASVALIGIGGWFITTQVVAFRSEAWLIANGVTVNAKVVAANGDTRNGSKNPPGSPVSLRYDWKDQTIDVAGSLSTNDFITTGEMVQIHVDPNDTSVWTDRTAPEPLARRLIAGAIIIPAVMITIAGALLLRRRVLRVWRDADAALYSVVETRYSALAPLSHTVQCVLANQRDPTVVVVHVPARFPRPQPGELLWLIHRAGKAKGAIAACAFE
jgi:hypothetical protein